MPENEKTGQPTKAEPFQLWKYLSTKFLLPLVAMLLWAWLIYCGRITSTNDMLVTGAGLLMFSGLFSAHDALLAYLKKEERK